MKLIPLMIVMFGLAGVPAALAQGCCSGQTAGHAGCNMAADAASGGRLVQCVAQTAAPGEAAAPRQVFKQPVQSVFEDYMKVQSALARDSLEGVSAKASAMAKAIRSDSTKSLSPKVAEQAEALAKAKNLEAARAALKPLSASLITYVKAQKLPAGTYYEAYCPMAKASWLQTNKTIINPYMGKGMLSCGEIKE